MTDLLGSEWHFSSAGYNLISENGAIKERQKLLEAALNSDLKDICSPILQNELSKDKTSKIVLQIQKIRNISAPKANEESQAAPRLLKLSLSDGENHVQAIEIIPNSSISRNHTPPGTKVLINNAKISAGYLLLTPSTCILLGGKVPSLVEKWEIAKSVQRNHRRNSNEDGPPAWVNFGTKIQINNQDNNFKSLGNKNKDSTKENSEFELQRQGAIAEATSGAIKKVFGGKVKQNIQPITNQNPRHFEKKEPVRNKKLIPKEKEFDEKPQKPSGTLSLFSFLEYKLPVNKNSGKTEVSNGPNKVVKSTVSINKTEPSFKPVVPNYNFNQSNRDYKQDHVHQNHNLDQPNRDYKQGHVQQNHNQDQPSRDYKQGHVQQNHNQDHPSRDYKQGHVQQNHNLDKPNRDSKGPVHQTHNLEKPSRDYKQGPVHHNHNLDQTSRDYKQAPVHQNHNLDHASRDYKQGYVQQNHNLDRTSRDFKQGGVHQNRENPKQDVNSAPQNRYGNYSQNYNPARYNSDKPRYNNPQKQDRQNNNQRESFKHFDKFQPPPKPNHNSNGTVSLPQETFQRPPPHIAVPNKEHQQAIPQNNFHQTSKDLNETVNHMEKMSLNSQFASRSLRQHLNLGPQKKADDMGSKGEIPPNSQWNIGDECLAKYWEDGKYYQADIVAVTDKTVVVKFRGYGNIEEILRTDCLTVTDNNKQNYQGQSDRRYEQNGRPYSGSMEFRRRRRV